MTRFDAILDSSTAQGIANALHGCAKLRYRPPEELVINFVKHLTNKMQCKSMHVSSCLLSCLHLVCMPPSNVLHVLLQHMCASGDAGSQGSANTVFAVSGLLFLAQDSPTLQQCLHLLRNLASMCKPEVVEDATQLLQAHQACAAVGVEQLLPAALLEHCQQRLQKDPRKPVQSSLQKQVVGVLKGLDVLEHVRTEQPVLMGTSHTDVLCITGSGAQVLVEVDGPSHFFANQAGMLDGSSRLKHALLRHQGHMLVSLDYRDWIACKGSAAQRALLMRLLGEAVPGL